MNKRNKLNNMEEMAAHEENVDKTTTGSGMYDADDENQQPVNERSLNDQELQSGEKEEELNAQKEKYVRLMAEFENYKRRTNMEKLDIIQTAGKSILTAMLDILDDMDRAEKQIAQDTDIDHVKEGVSLVFSKFRTLMSSKGVEPMDVVNTVFDAETQEAVANVPAPSPDKVGVVVDEVQKGYKLNDKIIRYPKVVVAN